MITVRSLVGTHIAAGRQTPAGCLWAWAGLVGPVQLHQVYARFAPSGAYALTLYYYGSMPMRSWHSTHYLYGRVCILMGRDTPTGGVGEAPVSDAASRTDRTDYGHLGVL